MTHLPHIDTVLVALAALAIPALLWCSGYLVRMAQHEAAVTRDLEHVGALRNHALLLADKGRHDAAHAFAEYAARIANTHKDRA